MHTAVAIVKKIDPKARKVTLDHEPVNTLNWPAMTMGFKVGVKDAVFESSGLRLIVDADSLPHLTGMTVDIETEGLSQRLRFDCPT